MKRQTPRWLQEAVAWSATAVLLVGGITAWSGVIDEKTFMSTVAGEQLGVDPSPVAAPSQPPARVNAVVKARTKKVVNQLPREPVLGKPPGPIVNVAPEKVALPQDRYALLVGITKYRKPTRDTLAGAKDVAFIRDYLLANGWLPQNIKVVTNRRATGEGIRAGLNWLVGKSQPGTFTLFHFSGHVKQEGGHEKLWSYDRDFVTDTALAKVIARGKGKMWVDIAGCEAGGFNEPGLASNRVLLTMSSKRTEKSYEHPEWGESIWVAMLWDSGLSQGHADLNKDGVTTIGESIVWASYWSQAITLRQRPHGRQSPRSAGDPVRGWTIANPPA